MLDGLNVSMQVASQTRDFPLTQENKVMPTGLLSSPRSRPTGLRSDGMPTG